MLLEYIQEVIAVMEETGCSLADAELEVLQDYEPEELAEILG